MSSPTSAPPLPTILALSRQITDPAQRRHAARALARLFGADDALVVLRDPEVDELLPGPGFPQTLPDGLTWRAFFAATAAAGTHVGHLRAPETGMAGAAVGVAADDGTQVVLLGGAPNPDLLDPVRALLPLIAAALRGEMAAQAARAQAALAGRRVTEAEALSEALDRARVRMETLAADNAQLYEAERQARTEAETAVRLRDEFLSIASHELRTPVAAIKGTAQLALRLEKQGRLDLERAIRSLRSIEQTVDRLGTLTDDLLDVSRIRGGQLVLRKEPLDLVALVRDVICRHTEQLDVGHLLEAELPNHAIFMDADAGRLEQVFDNLLINAVKYSPAGGTVEVTLEAEPGSVTLLVRDPGIGLPPHAAEPIFEPFGRAENATARHIPGMGLGLYICRQIVQSHGGRIWAQSAGEGLGTTFYVCLPSVDVAAEQPNASAV